MARAALDSGTAKLAATPHLHPDFPGVKVEEIASRCEFLRGELEREQIPLEVVAAAEVSLVWAMDASDEQLARASYGQRGRDLLVETPFSHGVGLDLFISQLVAKGYRITLAHPERNARFQRDLAPLEALVDQGVLLQLNAESLLGSLDGGGPRQAAREILVRGLAHVIASDGHRGSGWRPVSRLASAVEAAAELVGSDRARWMTEDAPAAVLSGAQLPEPPAIIGKPRRRRLFGLR